jgi:hypothetical protein
MNTITIQLTESDQGRLDRLTEALEKLAGLVEAMSPAEVKPTEVPAPTEAPAPAKEQSTPKEAPSKPVEAPAPAEVKQPTPEPTQATEAKQDAPAYTLADIQRLVIHLCSPEIGLKAQVRDIVKAYADKVPNIPADKFVEVMGKLQTLATQAPGWEDLNGEAAPW